MVRIFVLAFGVVCVSRSPNPPGTHVIAWVRPTPFQSFMRVPGTNPLKISGLSVGSSARRRRARPVLEPVSVVIFSGKKQSMFKEL